jgi:hypothetical protein
VRDCSGVTFPGLRVVRGRYRNTTFDCHYLFIYVEYHGVENFAASGSNGYMSGKVAPSDISQETNAMRTMSQLK